MGVGGRRAQSSNYVLQVTQQARQPPLLSLGYHSTLHFSFSRRALHCCNSLSCRELLIYLLAIIVAPFTLAAPPAPPSLNHATTTAPHLFI